MSADLLISLIETIHDASVDGDLWTQVLAGTARLVGGIASTLEIVNRKTFRCEALYAYGVPRPDEIAYAEHYVAMNPRLAAALRQKPGEAAWDYQILDEQGMDRNPFYAEFLARLDMRYAVAGILQAGEDEFGAFAVQRSAKQGHVDQREIALMRRLSRHASQAIDVTRRLRSADSVRRSFEQALDWLADGVVLLDADAKVIYANRAFSEIAAANDGVAMKHGRLEFAHVQARQRFAEAWASLRRFLGGDFTAGGSDYAVARRLGAPSYLLSLRPLLSRRERRLAHQRGVAILLLRDPANTNRASLRIFREVLGLSEAEASLAHALQVGMPPTEYASKHQLSINTVYTHLKRIKEKSGCHRMSSLIRRLNDLQMLPLAELVTKARPPR